MTSDIAYLISKGYIPVIHHNQKSFKYFEEEVAKASKGILGKPVLAYALRSERSNAYTIRLPSGFFIGITDTLLQEVGNDLMDLIGHPIIAEFFSAECGCHYDPDAPAPVRVDPDRPFDARTLASFDNPKVYLFNDLFLDGAIGFILLHEIAHIKHGHLDNLAVGAAFADLPEVYGRPDQSYLDREREADAEAANFLTQANIQRYPKKYPRATTETWFYEIAVSFIGAVIPIRRLWRQVAKKATTHPIPQERALNIASWFGITVNSEYREMDAYQQTEFLKRLILAVEIAAKDLKWKPLTWKAKHLRPWLG